MRRALISVTDKAGVVEFARGLRELGFGILSTGGTRKALLEAGVDADEVADYTGFPELMDGRLKTLHPKVHGGLLGKRDDAGHVKAMAMHAIEPIDVLCVNLYRFRETAGKPGVSRSDVVENIDIGGPAMIRSAAKNHAHVAVVVDPADYGMVLRTLRDNGGRLPTDAARKLAAKAFAHTASYDAAIAAWFDCERRTMPGEAFFPQRAVFSGEKLQDLRYGENPHQQSAFYSFGDRGPSLASARQLCGKELSYNNILDADAALGLALEFEGPCCVIVKHNNPCGTAIAESPLRAFELALASDPVSAFGGILALNRTLEATLAAAIVQSNTFVEVIVAPHVEASALVELGKAKWGQNVRVLDLGGLPDDATRHRFIGRQVAGGFLFQTSDHPNEAPKDLVTTKRAPSMAEQKALWFAFAVCKHVKSNAIVLARSADDGSCHTVGVGAGQMSRVDAARLACEKAGEKANGAVLAGDAFFPFADGLQVCADAGVKAAIQPGGSKRDAEVIAAADAAGMAMMFTGQRHFRH
ncbi:MAG: bifunctional phosphoribosylaminoimidazolecarboxamide formyltransferase/IMP cyclohydrolase [Planctomycetota bacterium]|nr:bifunctional phosphoribosylaminoimidazolecarboxamide formyltransferase/IMP cyclohydrolase [Planctomycetota bacterium]